MTDREMTTAAMAAFEAQLERRLRAYAAVPVGSVDADAIAHDAATRRSGLPSAVVGGRVLAVAWLALLLAALALAVGIAAYLRTGPSIDRPLVFSTRLGGLYVADADGQDSLRIADDARYADPRWSPDHTLIAVLHGDPPSLEQLPDEELLVMRPDGVIIAQLPGPIRGFAWLVPSAGEQPIAAVRETDRTVVVMASDGQLLTEFEATSFPGIPTSVAAWPGAPGPGPAMIVSAGSAVVGISNAGAPTAQRTELVRVPAGQVNAAALSPDGRMVAYLHAACDTDCHGQVVIGAVGATAERVVADDVPAGRRPSWSLDGRSVLVWPNLVPIDGSGQVAMNTDSRIRELDVGGWWTRVAPDGRGVWFFRQFPGFNDRRWELYRIVEGANPRRLLNDITGADSQP